MLQERVFLGWRHEVHDLILRSGEDDDVDCQPIVYDRCGSNQIRSESGSCISVSQVSCAKSCNNGTGTYVSSLGICQCDKQPDLDLICDKKCRESSMQLQVNSATGELQLYDPVAGQIESLQNADATQGIVTKVSCTSSDCQLHALAIQTSGFSGSYDVPSSLSTWPSSSTSCRHRRRLATGTETSIPNPMMRLSVGSGVIFDLPTRGSYPIYLKDSMLNTNPSFDYGAFRSLASKVKSNSSSVTAFAFSSTEPGTYVFGNSLNGAAKTVIVIMREGTSCPTDGPIVPLNEKNLISVSAKRRTDDLILAPDWGLIFGLLGGLFGMAAAIITGLCYFRTKSWTNSSLRKQLAGYRAKSKQVDLASIHSKGSLVANKVVSSVDTTDKAQKPSPMTALGESSARSPHATEKSQDVYQADLGWWDDEDLDIRELVDRLQFHHESVAKCFEDQKGDVKKVTQQLRTETAELKRLFVNALLSSKSSSKGDSLRPLEQEISNPEVTTELAVDRSGSTAQDHIEDAKSLERNSFLLGNLERELVDRQRYEKRKSGAMEEVSQLLNQVEGWRQGLPELTTALANEMAINLEAQGDQPETTAASLPATFLEKIQNTVGDLESVLCSDPSTMTSSSVIQVVEGEKVRREIGAFVLEESQRHLHSLLPPKTEGKTTSVENEDMKKLLDLHEAVAKAQNREDGVVHAQDASLHKVGVVVPKVALALRELERDFKNELLKRKEEQNPSKERALKQQLEGKLSRILAELSRGAGKVRESLQKESSNVLKCEHACRDSETQLATALEASKKRFSTLREREREDAVAEAQVRLAAESAVRLQHDNESDALDKSETSAADPGREGAPAPERSRARCEDRPCDGGGCSSGGGEKSHGDGAGAGDRAALKGVRREEQGAPAEQPGGPGDAEEEAGGALEAGERSGGGDEWLSVGGDLVDESGQPVSRSDTDERLQAASGGSAETKTQQQLEDTNPSTHQPPTVSHAANLVTGAQQQAKDVAAIEQLFALSLIPLQLSLLTGVELAVNQRHQAEASALVSAQFEEKMAVVRQGMSDMLQQKASAKALELSNPDSFPQEREKKLQDIDKEFDLKIREREQKLLSDVEQAQQTQAKALKEKQLAQIAFLLNHFAPHHAVAVARRNAQHTNGRPGREQLQQNDSATRAASISEAESEHADLVNELRARLQVEKNERIRELSDEKQIELKRSHEQLGKDLAALETRFSQLVELEKAEVDKTFRERLEQLTRNTVGRKASSGTSKADEAQRTEFETEKNAQVSRLVLMLRGRQATQAEHLRKLAEKRREMLEDEFIRKVHVVTAKTSQRVVEEREMLVRKQAMMKSESPRKDRMKDHESDTNAQDLSGKSGECDLTHVLEARLATIEGMLRDRLKFASRPDADTESNAEKPESRVDTDTASSPAADSAAAIASYRATIKDAISRGCRAESDFLPSTTVISPKRLELLRGDPLRVEAMSASMQTRLDFVTLVLQLATSPVSSSFPPAKSASTGNERPFQVVVVKSLSEEVAANSSSFASYLDDTSQTLYLRAACLLDLSTGQLAILALHAMAEAQTKSADVSDPIFISKMYELLVQCYQNLFQSKQQQQHEAEPTQSQASSSNRPATLPVTGAALNRQWRVRLHEMESFLTSLERSEGLSTSASTTSLTLLGAASTSLERNASLKRLSLSLGSSSSRSLLGKKSPIAMELFVIHERKQLLQEKLYTAEKLYTQVLRQYQEQKESLEYLQEMLTEEQEEGEHEVAELEAALLLTRKERSATLWRSSRPRSSVSRQANRQASRQASRQAGHQNRQQERSIECRQQQRVTLGEVAPVFRRAH